MIDLKNLERRLFWYGAWLTGIGGILTAFIFGLADGISFIIGGLLSAINLAILRHAITALLHSPSKRSKAAVLASYFLRLLLIPICLYAMMRFLFLSIIAAVAGFAIFNCSVFIEGIREAVKGSYK